MTAEAAARNLYDVAAWEVAAVAAQSDLELGEHRKAPEVGIVAVAIGRAADSAGRIETVEAEPEAADMRPVLEDP